MMTFGLRVSTSASLIRSGVLLKEELDAGVVRGLRVPAVFHALDLRRTESVHVDDQPHARIPLQ